MTCIYIEKGTGQSHREDLVKMLKKPVPTTGQERDHRKEINQQHL